MATFRTLSTALRRTAQRIDRATVQLQRDVTVQVATDVVTGTPIDTGQAKSNWQTSVGAPVSNTIPPYLPGRMGSTASGNIQAVIQQARAAVGGLTQGQETHVVNNLNYIGALNSGYSAQAPSGFVEHAIQNAVDVISRRRLF